MIIAGAERDMILRGSGRDEGVRCQIVRPEGFRIPALFAAIFLFLTPIREREYHFFVMGGIDYELNGRENASPKKRKVLSVIDEKNVFSNISISCFVLAGLQQRSETGIQCPG